MMITTTAPGKLFIAGEYAVVDNMPAIISSVKKYLTVTLTLTPNNLIISEQNKQHLMQFHRQQGTIQLLSENFYPIITKTIEITEQILQAYGHPIDKNYTIHITSDLDDTNGKKYGLGSSGAVSIAIIKVLYQLYQQPYTALEIYKIAVFVQLALQHNGSCGDIAACSFDTLIYYEKFDTNWLAQQLNTKSYHALLNSDWKNLIITPLPLPRHCSFLVGWSGSPASSSDLVNDVIRIKNSAFYTNFLAQSNTIVKQLKQAFISTDIDAIQRLLRQNRVLLNKLSPLIETPLLTTLCDIAEAHHCASKLSGAGGGDCGICFITNKNIIPKIEEDWQKKNIKSLGELIC